MRIKRIIAPVLIGLLAGSMLVQLPLAIADRSATYDWFNPIIDIRDILIRRHVKEPDLEKMQRATIEGMIASLGDPHTIYVQPEHRADFEKQLHGRYVGIGAEVNTIDGYLTIVTPMEGSPALEAGVLAGDIVLEIDGESTFNVPIQDSIDRLLGDPGTQVAIRVRHLDGSEEDLWITRRQIVTRTVRGLLRKPGANGGWIYCVDEELGIHYVRLTQFTESTVHDLVQALASANERGLNGLVLDLRDNPGGSLRAAVAVADLFLEKGVIVSSHDRLDQGEVFMAKEEGTLPHFPMVVLVNSASASASEVVSGALQENGRAKVLGTRTFGKASVQEVRQLPFDQGTLKLTIAHYHLPSGRDLNRMPESTVWGVDPDPGFVMPVSDEEYLAMLRARRDYEIIQESNGAPSCADPEWIRNHLLDEQLVAAVESIQTRMRGEQWPSPGEDEATHVAFDEELKRIAHERSRLLERLAMVEERMKELDDLAQVAGREDLIPDDIDFALGTVTLRDRHGNKVGTFRIDGGDLELALQSLRLSRVEE